MSEQPEQPKPPKPLTFKFHPTDDGCILFFPEPVSIIKFTKEEARKLANEFRNASKPGKWR